MTSPKQDQEKKIEKIFGIKINNPDLLRQALTHSSSREDENYERMEFLGDRVLALCVADLLYQKFPEENEGDLAKRHAALVSGDVLADIAREIDLSKLVILSDAERKAGGENNNSILADCVESCLGALYLDQGYERCAQVLENLYGQRMLICKDPPQDPKTRLQEWAQGQGYDLPAYKMIKKSGPDHAPEFTIHLTLPGLSAITATGGSKREAEKKAAEKMLDIIDKNQR